uniref:Uncharacterized protein MANES_01G244400 n=1 Tax=Rhizophora mucronata TaxID=61149 RepID=A0A2P2IMK6_RHIMU
MDARDAKSNALSGFSPETMASRASFTKKRPRSQLSRDDSSAEIFSAVVLEGLVCGLEMEVGGGVRFKMEYGVLTSSFRGGGRGSGVPSGGVFTENKLDIVARKFLGRSSNQTGSVEIPSFCFCCKKT